MEVVTQELIDRAKRLGACNNGLPTVGARIYDLTFDQLAWAEEHSLLTSDEFTELPVSSLVITGQLPLWTLSELGYGYGYGYGYEYGYGYGYGYGDEYGYGDGYGDGDEYGYGDGYGDGYGYG